MLYLMTGGSGSGKSAYAEAAAVSWRERHCPQGRLYYVATMIPWDAECEKRIERHRKMRKEKGFHTIERYWDIGRLEEDSEAAVTKQDVLLVECLSNLLANERYGQPDVYAGSIRKEKEEALREAKQAILSPLLALNARAGGLFLVTNEVFSEGKAEGDMEEYCRLLGGLNCLIAARADGVAEVACGIPFAVKGELPC